jgi:hypothetical protein
MKAKFKGEVNKIKHFKITIAFAIFFIIFGANITLVFPQIPLFVVTLITCCGFVLSTLFLWIEFSISASSNTMKKIREHILNLDMGEKYTKKYCEKYSETDLVIFKDNWYGLKIKLLTKDKPWLNREIFVYFNTETEKFHIEPSEKKRGVIK